MRQILRYVVALALAASTVAWVHAPGSGAAEETSAAGRYEPHAMGDADAPVTLVEFSSLTCPHCASFHSETLPQIKKSYVEPGQVRYVYRDFPLDNLAMGAAMLTHCVDESRYFGFLDTLFANQARWAGSGNPLENLRAMARLAGLSNEAFDACLNDESLLAAIRDAASEEGEKYGIASTPSFVIDGKKVTGAVDFDTMKRHLDEAIAAAPASSGAGSKD